jgi:hypothetical protein
MRTIDHLTNAAIAVRPFGPYSDWRIKEYWEQCMDPEAHLKFDGFLLKTGDELAAAYGPPVSRFVERVKRMAFPAQA